MNKTYRKITAAAAVFMTCTVLLAAVSGVFAVFGRGADEPAVSAFAKSQSLGEILTFTAGDFTSRVSGKEELSSILISELPKDGILRLAGREVAYGELLETDKLDMLCYVPHDPAEDVHTSFSFIPVFSRSGAAEESVTVALNLSDQFNAAPVALDLYFKTYAGVRLCGELRGSDPEGDELNYSVVRQPKKGSMEINGGSFAYTPISGKSGTDSFTYIATDRYGNASAAATVDIEICKRTSKETFTYTDMKNDPSHFAALYLREMGVLSGESFGGESFLYPDKPVSRAEFVAMTAAISEMALPTAAVGTGMADNDDIPAWAQPYVAAALNCGVVYGERSDDGNRVFRASSSITRAEAASIIDRALGLADDGRRPSFADSDALPEWAAQSIVNTAAAGIVPVFSDNTVRASTAVTRSDACAMLYQMICHMQSRNERGGIFGIFN